VTGAASDAKHFWLRPWPLGGAPIVPHCVLTTAQTLLREGFDAECGPTTLCSGGGHRSQDKTPNSGQALAHSLPELCRVLAIKIVVECLLSRAISSLAIACGYSTRCQVTNPGCCARAELQEARCLCRLLKLTRLHGPGIAVSAKQARY